MPSIKVNNINLYYELSGQGKTIVLICGLGTDISEYRPIIANLAEKYQVLAFDNRGAGRSDKPHTAYTIKMMADDTFGLLKHLNINQATIIGISMGSRIALELSLSHPETVNKLILVSAAARPKVQWFFYVLLLSHKLHLFASQYPQPILTSHTSCTHFTKLERSESEI